MQWEHFRAACQEALRQLSNGADFRPFRTTLTLIATFGVEEYVGHSNTFSKGGTIEEARRLQSRYASAGHRSGMRPEASFWFSQRPGHYEVGITAGRLRLLSRTAQDVLLEHVKYIANLDPLPAIDKLPSFDQLLVNAELGASYIRIKEAVLACGLPQEVKATYEQKFDFPALTTLPLELIAEITSDLEDAARHAHKHTLGHLFGTAAVAIYTSRVEAIVRCLRKTFITPAAIEKWKEDYLLPLKGWSGVGWSPSEMATEWAELQRVENDLLVGVFLSIDKLGPFSLAHGYARISHRMARRIGTSKEAWEAERTTRGF
uniref:FGENESH: predicted gene_16.67 protein n=1 Tax=Rhodotorula toruloides TaxID=5286 RepID=A0A0K3CRQ2_RHOTO